MWGGIQHVTNAGFDGVVGGSVATWGQERLEERRNAGKKTEEERSQWGSNIVQCGWHNGTLTIKGVEDATKYQGNGARVGGG